MVRGKMYGRDTIRALDRANLDDQVVRCRSEAVIRADDEQRMRSKAASLSRETPRECMGDRLLGKTRRSAASQRVKAFPLQRCGQWSNRRLSLSLTNRGHDAIETRRRDQSHAKQLRMAR